jgi:hypothetical protein
MQGLAQFFVRYNGQRQHQVLGYQTPASGYFSRGTHGRLSSLSLFFVLTMGSILEIENIIARRRADRVESCPYVFHNKGVRIKHYNRA